jgi:hypothetical protein
MKMTQPNKLFIATQFKCKECEEFKDVYTQTLYLNNLGLLEKDKLFDEILLNDLEEHIKTKHLDRYNSFVLGK